MDGRYTQSPDGAGDGTVLSAVGRVREINASTDPQLLAAHLNRHPGLVAFTQAPDCVLLEVVVESYQMVRGIEDVSWMSALELGS